MKLDEYLGKVGIEVPLFAKQLGVTAETVRTIIRGNRDIRLSVALLIEELTYGKVSPRDLMTAPREMMRYGKREKKQQYAD